MQRKTNNITPTCNIIMFKKCNAYICMLFRRALGFLLANVTLSRAFTSSSSFIPRIFYEKNKDFILPKSRKTLTFPFWDGVKNSTFEALSLGSEAQKDDFLGTSVRVF